MKRLIGLLTAGLMTIAAGSGCQTDSPGQSKRPEGFSITPGKTIELVVPQDLPEPYLEGARELVSQVSRLSGESIYIELREEQEEDARNFAVTELILLPQTVMSAMSDQMKNIAMPFVFNSNAHLTEAVNAKAIMSYLGDSVEDNGLRPLLALSGTDPLFVNIGAPILSVYDFQQAHIYLHQGDLSIKNALNVLNVDSTLFEQEENLSRLLVEQARSAQAGDEVLIGESTMREMEAFGEQEYPVSVVWSMHRPEPYWLAAGNSFWSGLSSYEQDILSEGLSYMAGVTEQRLTENRQIFTKQMERRGIKVQSLLRQDFGNILYESGEYQDRRAEMMPYFDRWLYQQLQSYA